MKKTIKDLKEEIITMRRSINSKDLEKEEEVLFRRYEKEGSTGPSLRESWNGVLESRL